MLVHMIYKGNNKGKLSSNKAVKSSILILNTCMHMINNTNADLQ